MSDLTAQFGTPLYVYSESCIRDHFRYLTNIFRATSPLICYAVKANSHLAILSALRDEGSAFDIVSLGELRRLKRLAVPSDHIIYSGVGKTSTDLQEAVESSVLINLESTGEIQALIEICRQVGMQARVSLRVNPHIEAPTHPYISTGLRRHKFGFDATRLPAALEMLKQASRLRLVGVGTHIGSQILEMGPYIQSFERICVLADELADQGFPIEQVDIGGGFGVPYGEEDPPDLEILAQRMKEVECPYKILMEPGRFLVARSGALLTQVLYRKVNGNKQFVVVDAAMNDFLRPALYGAQHKIVSLTPTRKEVIADVVGPVCETGDFLARDANAPDAQPGDYLAILDAGAYGFVAASNYNSRPRPAEIMVYRDRATLIRPRESLDDLFAREWFPDRPRTAESTRD